MFTLGLPALVSAILGAVTGLAPRFLSMMETRANHQHEMEFMRLQHELQMARMQSEAGSKLREMDATLSLEEVRETKAAVVAAIEASAKPSGVRWIDGFNALLRPLAVTCILLLFMVVAGAYVRAVLIQYAEGTIADVSTLATLIWGGPIGFATESMLGFLFGAREARKRSAT